MPQSHCGENGRVSRKRKAAEPISSPEQVPDLLRESAGNITRLDWLIAITLAIVTLVVFSQTWSFGFTNWDDGPYITANRNLLDYEGLWRIWFSTENEQYYPLTFTTYWIEHHLWGDSATGYHVVNTSLHALNATLVLILCRRMGLSTFTAAGIAALFAVHPMQGMTVAWIAERKTLHACLFILLATLAWLNYVRSDKRLAYGCSLIFFALALLSKSAILLAPLTWLVLDIASFKRPLRKSIRSIIPMLLLAWLATVVTRHFESGFIDAQALTMIPTPLHRVLLAGTAIWWYVLKLVIPLDLAPVYPIWNIIPTHVGWWLGVGGFAIALAAVFEWRRRLRPAAKWGLAWFMLMLLPTLGLIAYGNLAVSPTSNHYIYVPCIGLFIAAGTVVEKWRSTAAMRWRITSVAFCAAVIVCIVAVRSQARVFADSKSLWSAALARDPNCFPAHLGLGQEALGERDYPTALAHYSAAVQIRPAQYEGYAALGEVHIRMQNWSDARSTLDAALTLRPDHVPAMLARAMVAEHDLDWLMALDLVRRANALDPLNPRAATQLGILLLRNVNNDQGDRPSNPDPTDPRIAEARAAFARVMTLRPNDDAGYRGAVECDRLRRDWASAISTARAGLEVAPNSVPLKNLLAITLARCPDERLRDSREAVRLAEDVVKALGSRNFQVLETLASAYGAAGQFDEATRLSREAARLARDAKQESAAKSNEQWAIDYAAHKPRLD